MTSKLKAAVPIAQAFSRLFYPFAEVVIHDLSKDKIAAIYNPFSKRKVGDSSYLERLDFSQPWEEDVIGPYEKINYDGRKLKSMSLVLRDNKNKAIGLLCVNVDVSVFEQLRHSLGLLTSTATTELSPRQQTLFKDDIYEQINAFVQAYCRDKHLLLDRLSRDQKRALLWKLKKNGAFRARNAAHYVARTLNLSRASIYNYLKEMES